VRDALASDVDTDEGALKQTSFFDEDDEREEPPPAAALARKTDPTSSHEAARVVGYRLSNLQAKVREALRVLGDMPVSDIAEAIGEPRDTISPRLKPMEKHGFVKRLGDEHKRVPRDPNLRVKQTVWSYVETTHPE
jgi:DNA-binding transcriptional ArsR family regulator